jgi:ribonucleoside-diphosphate reductase alpha chain
MQEKGSSAVVALEAKSIQTQRVDCKGDRGSKYDASHLFTVVKRNGMIVPFRRDRIFMAVEAAFRDTRQIPRTEPLPAELYKTVQRVCDLVVEEVLSSKGACLTVEGIQDIVEVKLMEAGYHDVARDYIIYRDHHKTLREDSPRNIKVSRRDGTLARFNPMKIASAIEKAFRASLHIEGTTPEGVVNSVNLLTNKVVGQVVLMAKEGSALDVDQIQDLVEQQLMAEGYYGVAKDIILYRAMRKVARQQDGEVVEEEKVSEEGLEEEVVEGRVFAVTLPDGRAGTLSEREVRQRVERACRGFDSLVCAEDIVQQSINNFYDGIRLDEVDVSNIMAAKARIETEPAYSYVASHLLLDVVYRETLGVESTDPKLKQRHQRYFRKYLERGVELDRINPELLAFDIEKLAKAMDLERDRKLTYLGLQTLYDRYFVHDKGVRLETPQIFWMRVAMGLALREGNQKEDRAIEFYNVLSRFLYVSATPTLFNSGTTHAQLSSCYLLTVQDDLSSIFKTYADNAQLSKWAGGLGDDWTNVRATGAMIKGTNGTSQGVIPFLKIANDTAVAVNQGGKRKGALCSYLETWHLDLEDFLELRKNTGDERRRTHDMNTANWIPDLFMKRVKEKGLWTLFSPSDVPDLHDLYGRAFERRYVEYEKMVDEGKITLYKRVEAEQLFRRMLGMLFETGHPWITFKDPSNIRSPQGHVGVVHSSNLCTEILLNTSEEETAVCNLGSINLAAHTTPKGLNEELLAQTISTAMRMLDNVIDINYYPTAEARNSNLRHRPVGLGLMGFQDALYIQGISYASHQAVEFADISQEMISYYAILASSELAKERGPYATYKGSKWDQGILPIDSLKLLAEERGGDLDVDTSVRLNWGPVRESVKRHGMRNSNTMAIAPTATISNIAGVTQSIEPMYKHLFVKSNLSGEFTVPNVYLVEKLKDLDLWDDQMVDDLKYFDGSIVEVDRIPEEVKLLFLTAFEIEPEWLIECASRRQKWIDMGQSLNLYLSVPSGKRLFTMYMDAWRKGLKTTYYLRSLGATQIEKSTTDINRRALQPRWMKNESPSSRVQIQRDEKRPAPACNLEEGCESCQ